MNLRGWSRKDIGAYGERAAAQYLRQKGFKVVGKNVARKTGELDLIIQKGKTLHFVEVKSMLCLEFPPDSLAADRYDPSENLHPYKVRKVARTAEWYVAEMEWEGEWQIDAVLVWLRERDGAAKVTYLPQIV